jgi:integrase/recombinase XerD
MARGGCEMKTITFHSWLAEDIRRFIQWREVLGRDPYLQSKLLRYFDRFLVDQRLAGPPLTAQITEQYFDSLERFSSSTGRNRSTVVRELCAYIYQADERCHVPEPRRYETEPFQPFIFSIEQVQALLSAALKLTRGAPLHPLTHYTLFGVLYATGMRIGEAMALTLADYDAQRGRLYIAEGKFHKSRWLPLHPSTTEAIERYVKERRSVLPNGSGATLFVNQNGKPLRHGNLYCVYQKLLRVTGLSELPQGPPRIHDLRHTFAVHRLLAWYREGGDVNAHLPALATYMGHVSICSTQVYLQPTEELLGHVSSRFHQHYLHNVKPQGKTL